MLNDEKSELYEATDISILGRYPGSSSDGPEVSNFTNAPDPFNLDNLRVNNDEIDIFSPRQESVSFLAMKPTREMWFRTNPDPDYKIYVGMIELKSQSQNQFYLVDKTLWGQLAEEPTFTFRKLVITKSRTGGYFFWPLRVPNPDGSIDSWSRSANNAAIRAEREWIRMISNKAISAYDVLVVKTVVDEPIWPTEPLRDLIELAFSDKFIRDSNHIVLQTLRGEA